MHKGQGLQVSELKIRAKEKSFSTCVLQMHNVISHSLSRATTPGGK